MNEITYNERAKLRTLIEKEAVRIARELAADDRTKVFLYKQNHRLYKKTIKGKYYREGGYMT